MEPEHREGLGQLLRYQTRPPVDLVRLQRDPDHTKVRAALTDGERALQKRIRRVLPGAILILDLMHALDRIWLIAAVLCGSDSAVYLSGDFDAYWAHHVSAEQARLYPDGCWEVVNSVD